MTSRGVRGSRSQPFVKVRVHTNQNIQAFAPSLTTSKFHYIPMCAWHSVSGVHLNWCKSGNFFYSIPSCTLFALNPVYYITTMLVATKYKYEYTGFHNDEDMVFFDPMASSLVVMNLKIANAEISTYKWHWKILDSLYVGYMVLIRLELNRFYRY